MMYISEYNPVYLPYNLVPIGIMYLLTNIFNTINFTWYSIISQSDMVA